MDRVLIASRLCKNLDLALGETLFGGRILEWTAECGSVFAMKNAGVSSHMVLYRIDGLRIVRPVRVGEVLDFYASDIRRGHTSLSFQISGSVAGAPVLSLDCTYVRVDDNGAKVPLPAAE